MHGTIPRIGNWTEDRVAILTRMWGEGATCSQIANALGGVTRNAVIGKVSRIGLPLRGGKNWKWVDLSEDKRNARREMKRRERRRKARLAYVNGERPKADVSLPRPSISDEAIPLDQRRTLMRLENCHCRWPVGDPGTPGFFFCGAPEADRANGRPYCPGHAGRAYQRSAA